MSGQLDEAYLRENKLVWVDGWLTPSTDLFALYRTKGVSYSAALRHWLALDSRSPRMWAWWSAILGSALASLRGHTQWLGVCLFLTIFYGSLLIRMVRSTVRGVLTFGAAQQFLPHSHSADLVVAVVGPDRVIFRKRDAEKLVAAWRDMEIAYLRDGAPYLMPIAVRPLTPTLSPLEGRGSTASLRDPPT
ncbi:MAG: hypothetical protein U0228_24870 [Myxococcaceae bacterium]